MILEWITLMFLAYLFVGSVIAGVYLGSNKYIGKDIRQDEAVLVMLVWPFILIFGIYVSTAFLTESITFWILKRMERSGTRDESI